MNSLGGALRMPTCNRWFCAMRVRMMPLSSPWAMLAIWSANAGLVPVTRQESRLSPVVAVVGHKPLHGFVGGLAGHLPTGERGVAVGGPERIGFPGQV